MILSPSQILSAITFSRRGTGLLTSHLLRIIILCGTNKLVLAIGTTFTDRKQNMTIPALPSLVPNEHTPSRLIILIALVFITLAYLCACRRICFRLTGNRERRGCVAQIVRIPPDAVSSVSISPSPIRFPPAPYLGNVRQQGNPVPILGMLDPLTAVPRNMRQPVPLHGARRYATPDLIVALLSLSLTFAGTVIGGVALIYTKHPVSRS